jgi:hypothetical protein
VWVPLPTVPRSNKALMDTLLVIIELAWLSWKGSGIRKFIVLEQFPGEDIFPVFVLWSPLIWILEQRTCHITIRRVPMMHNNFHNKCTGMLQVCIYQWAFCRLLNFLQPEFKLLDFATCEWSVSTLPLASKKLGTWLHTKCRQPHQWNQKTTWM